MYCTPCSTRTRGVMSKSCSARTAPAASRPSSPSTPPPWAPRSAVRASTRTRTRTEAVADALNLARGMSYKNAMAGLDHGGGKAVIIGDPDADQERGAAARLRPVRRLARRPLRHRVRRRHVCRRHGRRGPRVPLDDRPLAGARRRGRLLRAHRLRRLPGHARLRPAPVGRPVAARPHGRHRGRRQGRPPPGGAPARRRAPRSSITDVREEAVRRILAAHPRA